MSPQDRRSPKERLLDDVMAESLPRDFRDQVYAQFRAHLTQKHSRSKRPALALAATLAALAIAAAGLLLFDSRPSSSVTIVHSASLPQEMVVSSAAPHEGAIEWVTNDQSALAAEIIENRTSTLDVTYINDEALFAAFDKRPVALVRVPSGRTRFMVLDSSDAPGTVR